MKRKVVVGVIIISILVIIGAIGITMKKNEKGGTALTEEKVSELVSNKGKVVAFKENEKDIVMDINTGENESNITQTIAKESKGDKEVIINFIEENIQGNNEFYFDGLKKRAIINKDKKTIESFEKKEVKKAQFIEVDYADGKVIKNKEGRVVVETKINDTEKNVVEQILVFMEIFKNTNKEKDIKEIQVNFIGDTKGYKYNEKFKDIVATVEVLK